jgi:ribosomal protein S21
MRLKSRRSTTPMQVLVRDNDIDQALPVLKKKMQREGVFREMKAGTTSQRCCSAPAARQSSDRSRWGDPVRLFIFESNAKTGLRAFVGDVAGRNLPDQFSPWRQIGAVASGNAPPYNLSRDTIEKAISAHGFQLWRVKPKMA